MNISTLPPKNWASEQLAERPTFWRQFISRGGLTVVTLTLAIAGLVMIARGNFLAWRGADPTVLPTVKERSFQELKGVNILGETSVRDRSWADYLTSPLSRSEARRLLVVTGQQSFIGNLTINGFSSELTLPGDIRRVRLYESSVTTYIQNDTVMLEQGRNRLAVYSQPGTIDYLFDRARQELLLLVLDRATTRQSIYSYTSRSELITITNRLDFPLTELVGVDQAAVIGRDLSGACWRVNMLSKVQDATPCPSSELLTTNYLAESSKQLTGEIQTSKDRKTVARLKLGELPRQAFAYGNGYVYHKYLQVATNGSWQAEEMGIYELADQTERIIYVPADQETISELWLTASRLYLISSISGRSVLNLIDLSSESVNELTIPECSIQCSYYFL